MPVLPDATAPRRNHPRDLVAAGEAGVPEAVARTAAFLERIGVAARYSRNAEARSCRDAAHKRQRLAATGIPLHDELKSFLGRFADRAGVVRRVMLHCRGDQELDLDAAARVLGAVGPIERLADDALAALGLQYGTVNPFNGGTTLHVFDPSVRERRGLPGTMMTNAGALTWGVELYADELIDALGDALVAPIVAGARRAADAVAPIGVISSGGGDGRALWGFIEDGVRDGLGADWRGNLSCPPVRLFAVPALALLADDRAAPALDGLRDAVAALAAQGARTLAVASPAAWAYEARLRVWCDSRAVTLVSLPGAVHDALAGADDVTVLALDPTPWAAIGRAPTERGRAWLQALVQRVQREGASEGARQQLRDLLAREASAPTVVLAEPELGLLVRTQRRAGRSGRVLIDALEVYGRALADRWLGRGPR